jgi:hypothetical protein
MSDLCPQDGEAMLRLCVKRLQELVEQAPRLRDKKRAARLLASMWKQWPDLKPKQEIKDGAQ